MALEFVMRQLNIGRANLMNKSVQLATYADDINIRARSAKEADAVYSQLKIKAKTHRRQGHWHNYEQMKISE